MREKTPLPQDYHAPVSVPRTLAEAIDHERTLWGDAWDDRKGEPTPTCVMAWIGDCWAVLSRGLPARHIREECIRAGMRARNAGLSITDAQEQQIGKRLARGDQLKEIVAAWQDADQERTGVRPTQEQACKRRGRLAHLVELRLLPAPLNPIVAEWLDGRLATRTSVSLDQRMAEASAAVAKGSWG